jgi:hypothetical protein
MPPSSRLGTTATVEGMDVLKLPAGRFPAWRIRIFGGTPEYTVRFGRAGYLGSKQHFESAPAADPRYVQIIYDHVDSLAALDLVRPTAVKTAAMAPHGGRAPR